MRKRALITLLTSATLIAADLCAASGATSERASRERGSFVAVPQGLIVRVVIESELSSAKSLVGDTFAVHAVQDVAVGNYIVIRAGAQGRGEITADSPANGSVAGQLAYTLDYITGVDGKKIRLTGTSDNSHNAAAINGSAEDANRSAALTSTATDVATRVGAVSAVTGALGPLGGVASMAGSFFGHAKARNAVIASNTTVPSYVAATVHTFSNVEATLSSAGATDDGYAK